MNEMILEGGCLCGAVRYRAVTNGTAGGPLLVEYCHCSQCRKAGGAPVVAWMDIPAGAMEWLKGKPKEYSSSEFAWRGFCGDCGSPLSFRKKKGGGEITLTVASLDRPERVAPRQHIFHGARLPWLVLADDLPRHETWPQDTDPTG